MYLDLNGCVALTEATELFHIPCYLDMGRQTSTELLPFFMPSVAQNMPAIKRLKGILKANSRLGSDESATAPKSFQRLFLGWTPEKVVAAVEGLHDHRRDAPLRGQEAYPDESTKPAQGMGMCP